MTRKRFWGLRNALNVRLNEWAKGMYGECPSGESEKALRPKAGVPLIDFKKSKELGYGDSYKECWERMKEFRSGLGM